MARPWCIPSQWRNWPHSFSIFLSKMENKILCQIESATWQHDSQTQVFFCGCAGAIIIRANATCITSHSKTLDKFYSLKFTFSHLAFVKLSAELVKFYLSKYQFFFSKTFYLFFKQNYFIDYQFFNQF